MKMIDRHRMVNKLLATELSTLIHALSIQVTAIFLIYYYTFYEDLRFKNAFISTSFFSSFPTILLHHFTQAKTRSQWEADPSFKETPNCLGGSKR